MIVEIFKGMGLLDASHPGWEKLINLDTLDIADTGSCILGQLFGGYGEGKDALGIWAQPWNYGFVEGNSYSDEELTEYWKEAIEERLGGE